MTGVIHEFLLMYSVLYFIEIPEKHKEKKHKKEKKDKERREGKDKKGKERSDEKHREKKDRKEKYKDKKEKHRDKKKDREKDREKKSISDESTVVGKLEESSGEKLHSEGHNKIKSSFTREAKHATHFLDQNGGKLIQNSLLQGSEESKFVQELDRRIRDDEKGAESQLLNRISGISKRDQGATSRAGNRDSSGVLAGDKGKNKDKRVDSRKVDLQEFREEFSANMVQKNAGMAKSKVEAMPKPMEEHKDSRLEDKERSKEKSDDSQGDKHKGKDRDKKVHGKDKARKKEKKKEKRREEKEKGIIENKKSEQDRSNYVGRNDLVGVTSNTSTHLLMDINGNAVDEGNIRKIEDANVNGFLHESEVRPNKLQRLTPHQLTENERNLEACQNPNVSASYKQMPPYDICSDNEDQRMTVTLEAHELCPSKPKPTTATTPIDQNVETSKKSVHLDSKFPNEVLRLPKMENLIAEASRRPPHPDFKYLSEILTVPKMEELQIDDQEWLFYKKDPPSKKPMVGFCGVREDLSVWSEAMYIESAEVYALPYVIPY
ncbi:DNA ligase 1-like [Olea europaea var. sylvestris]|uniref:DNA ligase 1-like n=1 Tax=Olea europaea var. sylvestris TaxID=158386 RepID=UPI000C1D85FE|nr:DNA ligase 1-like [Olea europaea var. sylvestris]